VATKQINKKHKEAIRRKREAESTVSNLGLSINDNLQSIGIALEHIGLSQLSFCVLRNIHSINQKYIGLDINVFIQKIMPEVTEVSCPIFGIKDIFKWNYPIITTSMLTTIDALNSYSKFIYFYAFDLDFMDIENLQTSIINKCFCDERVTVITRSKIYKEIIEKEFGIKTHQNILSDFNIIEMVKIIFGDKRNGTIKNE
jgi:hypothetical protein